MIPDHIQRYYQRQKKPLCFTRFQTEDCSRTCKEPLVCKEATERILKLREIAKAAFLECGKDN